MIAFRLPFAALAMSFAVAGFAIADQPIELASGTAQQHPQQPQLSVDDAGAIHIVFGIGDQIHYTCSVDAGQSFTKPAALPQTVSNMSLGMRRGPRIAAGSGFVCITAIGGKQGKGRDGELYAFRSTDAGKTWQSPATVNDEPAAAREGLHAMAVGPQGELCCVWLDLRNKGTKIFSSLSADGGATWAKNLLVYESPDGRVCECCHPSVTFDAAGGLYVMWRNTLDGNRDLYVCKSADRGQTFGSASKLGQGTWPLDRCPMDGGAVCALAPNQLATAWRRDKQIFLTVPGELKERSLGAGEQPWIAASPTGPYVVWLLKRGEALRLLPPGQSDSVELATHAADAVIATALSGRGPIVVAWEGRDSGRYSIQCQVVGQSAQ